MIRIQILICLFLTGSINDLSGQQSDEAPLDFSFSYIGDLAGCYRGGIQTGCAYLGLLDVSATLNTKGLDLWNNGNLFLNFQNTHHSSPGTQLAGDLQVFDNIDNGNQTYLYQLWYRQQIGNFWFLTGLHDLNSEFLLSTGSTEYINSSFGIMPVASLNSPVSIFPNTSLGFLTGYNAGKIEIKAAVYEGNPGNSDNDPHNLDLSADFDNGILGIFETTVYQGIVNERNGLIKAGLLIHTGQPSWIADSGVIKRGNYLLYAIADQRLFNFNSDDRFLDALIQAGIAPGNRNLSDFYFSLGLRFSGIFSGKNEEAMGVALAHASISDDLLRQKGAAMKPSETVAELYYRTNLNQKIFLQPDLQYIINPGIDPGIKNALVAILRIGIII